MILCQKVLKDQVEGDANTCCTAFYCYGNKESKNNVICPW